MYTELRTKLYIVYSENNIEGIPITTVYIKPGIKPYKATSPPSNVSWVVKLVPLIGRTHLLMVSHALYTMYTIIKLHGRFSNLQP